MGGGTGQKRGCEGQDRIWGRGTGQNRRGEGGRDRICGQPEKKPTFICEQEYIIIIENKSGRIKRTIVIDIPLLTMCKRI